MNNKKKVRNMFILVITLFCIQSFMYSQSVSLDIEKEKELSHGVGMALKPNTQIHSIFNNSEVVRISEDIDDYRNFGKYVEVKTSITYNFKGKDVADTVYLVYSNLSTINVNIGQITGPETIIGLSGGKGTNIYKNNTDMFIYLYTKKPSPFLNRETNFKCIEENGIYWWDPSILFKN